jgi:hypothetical protein
VVDTGQWGEYEGGEEAADLVADSGTADPNRFEVSLFALAFVFGGAGRGGVGGGRA